MAHFPQTGNAIALLFTALAIFMVTPAAADTFTASLGQDGQAAISFQPLLAGGGSGRAATSFITRQLRKVNGACWFSIPRTTPRSAQILGILKKCGPNSWGSQESRSFRWERCRRTTM